MMVQTVKCPKCGTEIPLDEAISTQVRQELRKELEQPLREQEERLGRLQEVLTSREMALENAKKAQDRLVEERIAEKRREIADEANRVAAKNVSLELTSLKNQVAEGQKSLELAHKNELQLREDRRKLEEDREKLTLQVARQIDEERKRIRDDAFKAFAEEHDLKDKEKEGTIADLRKRLDEMKQRIEQGSQQAQGEVLEQDLEAVMKSAFPFDLIEPVPTGKKGADVIQRVRDAAGQVCGSIIWETKRTKAWSEGWIQKLKDDQREQKADQAVILTTTLPKEIDNFASRSGVWVTCYDCALGLGSMLREWLTQVAAAKAATQGKGTKMEMLYDYLSGPDFRRRVEAIVDAFSSMRSDLDSEKRSMARIWATREKQIERMTLNTARMYGELQGIIGAALAKIEHLELKQIAKAESDRGS